METVVAFNTELSGLYDSKPPISKAKMASITRAAMKAIKFYKHVVQSVEKFILKCKPEYKIPGLYVIDSIVRQSRHQFGAEKDVFAPRFARNMKQTFANLFRCAPEDKSRIIRVLNLWQKNSVFAAEVIQPLFDLADPNNPIYQMVPGAGGVQDISNTSNGLNTSGDGGTPNMDESHMSVDLTTASGHQTANTLDQSTIRQLQQLQQILIRQTNETASSGTGANQSDSVKFNKKLLDYDYGDDEEEDKTASPHVPNLLDGNNLTQLLKDPNVLRQLQTLQKLKQQEEKQSKLNEMRIQEEAFEKHLQNVLKGNTGSSGLGVQSGGDVVEKEVEFIANDGSKIEVINLDGNDSRSPTPDRDRYNKRRRGSRSRSPRDRGRDRRRRSSRSRSRSRVGGSRSPKSNRRRNSRERDRAKDKERDKEKEKEREYERERRRKGLPDLKKEHLSVCSTTLWVGHLSKLVQQEELSDTFGKYGDIVSIDMIHPRGCAFIVMNRRQDAHKAMSSLKSYKMQGRAITISWAAGKGVKSKEWKDYWDLDLGVSYIPWARLAVDTDLIMLEEGGMFDEDSMPDWMKGKLNQKKESKEKILSGGVFGMEGLPNVDTTQPPPTAGPTIIPGVPMVPPFPMGPVPRLLPPMGVPIPGNMVPGMPIPPNMVPGMPPPHMMMPPAGMVSGFGPMPHMDKSVPPPNAGPSDNAPMPPFMGNMHMPPMQHQPFGNMGMPPQFNPQQHQQTNAPMPFGGGNHQIDDHMDIEMEDENPMNILKPPAMNFNQPPPMLPPNFNMDIPGGMPTDNRKNDRDDSRDNNHRERNDFTNQRERGSRWGNERSISRDREMQSRDRNDMSDGRPDYNRGRPPQIEQINEMPAQIWRENGPNFQPPNFADNVRRGVVGSGPNIQIELQSAPPHHRPPPEFFDGRRDDFGMEGGVQLDFFQSAGNRFVQPGQGIARGSPMPMRGGPPQPQFGPRLGPMFIRGPVRPGPPAGFNFGNDVPPPQFERDERGGGNNIVGGGGRMRGGNNNSMDRRGGGQSNWRDNDDGRRGSRFQNRDRDGDRDNRDESKNRDRNDWDRGSSRNDQNRKSDRKTTPPAPSGYPRHDIEPEKNYTVPGGDTKYAGPGGDTEEDWDNELIERKTTPPPTRKATTPPQRKGTPPPQRKGTPPAPNVQIRHDSAPIKKIHAFEDTEEDWDRELSDHKLDDNFMNASRNEPIENSYQSPGNQSPSKSDEFLFARNPSPPPNNSEGNMDNWDEPELRGFNKSHNEDSFVIPDGPTSSRNEKQDDQSASCVNTTPLYDEPGEIASEKATDQS